jgi:hypothetical protein
MAGWPRSTRHASSRPPAKRIESGADGAVAVPVAVAERTSANEMILSGLLLEDRDVVIAD